MTSRLYIIIFLVLIFLGLGGFISIRLGFFPVAIVNKSPVAESRFNKVAEEVLASLSVYGTLPSNAEIKRIILQKVIEDQLIYSEAKKYFDAEILRGNANNETIRIMLGDKFKSSEISLDEWLVEAKKSASVHILISGFSWDNGNVIACRSGLNSEGQSGLTASSTLSLDC